MRFLFFTGGSTVGGMEAAFLSLMKGLVARGHQATAIVSGWTHREVPRVFPESLRYIALRSAIAAVIMRVPIAISRMSLATRTYW